MPYRWQKPRMVFVDSMSDLFHPAVRYDFIVDAFGLWPTRPGILQLLTKRSYRLMRLAEVLSWPSNVWVGVSIESNAYCFRADHLRQVKKAAVRFLSLEPLIGGCSGVKG